MSDLRDLYQELIVDHYRRPHNFGPLAGANRHAEGFNPLCGDHLSLSLKVVDGVIEDACFEGAGCAISTASASLMTDALKGKTEAEAEALFAVFHALVTAEDATSAEAPLGKLAVLAGVREFPTRVKCATLAWHTLLAALHQSDQPVSTE
ncbi:Fe-S cluster assembly sulfur transfer protein SufU [Pseudogulbenkiania ferrooxidans]|uniref:SUF system FeS assembly protein, NifU family n=1 Tax=Pseudogulbenkiania ferrooxidans 2002 TaxID=279714 RepID=B9Z0E4_9NEIS|nr:SUF system NifU family Fe-S cluster assembly protein [Pseudogulbenkiania ferrooxidans]EEG09550.1 SUF system FeS assembly protein, NifU family [Pseudogulbenkiania ferrooxidans 2002]